MRVHAVSLNYRDVAMVEHGVAPRGVQLPLLPCSDAAGEVVEIGSDVSRVKVGDRVATTVFQHWLDGDTLLPAAYGSVLAGGLDGVLADHIVVHENGLVRVPEHLSFDEASTLPCAAVTAWHALVTKGGVRAGETILVQGTGGVSIFALQFGLMVGARVIATSKSDEKLDRVRELGAWETINYANTPRLGGARRGADGRHGSRPRCRGGRSGNDGGVLQSGAARWDGLPHRRSHGLRYEGQPASGDGQGSPSPGDHRRFASDVRGHEPSDRRQRPDGR